MDVETYLSFLTQLRQTLDRLTQLEKRKIAAVQSGNLEELEQCMKQEQAASLALRGEEKKRADLLQQLGLSQGSIRDLANHCPAPYKQQANETVQQVLSSYRILTSTQQAARTLMESNLRYIQQRLDLPDKTHRKAPAPSSSQTDFRV